MTEISNEQLRAEYEAGATYAQLAEQHGLTSEGVRSRIRRQRGSLTNENPTKTGNANAATELLAERHGLSAGELKAILSSAKGKPNAARRTVLPTSSSSARFVVLSDTHIGHEKFHEALFLSAVKDSKDCDFVLHPGDHLEGMSGRPGHIYELTHVGYQAQLTYCRDLYSQFDVPIYGIDGNHDQWYKQKNNAGVVVGEEIASSIANYTHLGEWEGDLDLGGLRIKLFHANDGSAYSTSYKSQKLVESFSGGEKPDMVFSGHYHKALYHFIRNVHTYESGTICGQSRFMRGKKLAAHMGYWIVTVHYGKSGITRVVNEFVPWYEE